MDTIIITTSAIGLTGLVCGAALATAAKFLAVKEDPRIEEASELLPGANCGGCGFAGCADYAKAIIIDNVSINLCAPGGSGTLDALSKMMGIDAEATERKVAIVLCGGDRTNAGQKHAYNGVADCRAAHSVGAGDKQCRYGCLGYGSCVRACPVGAIELRDGLAVVHADTCISCGACVRTCPRALIKMIPASATTHVMCSSKDKGPIVKKACKVGCIGCRICMKLSDEGAFSMDGFLAVVNYEASFEGNAAATKCPGKCITDTSVPAEAPAQPTEEKEAAATA